MHLGLVSASNIPPQHTASKTFAGLELPWYAKLALVVGECFPGRTMALLGALAADKQNRGVDSGENLGISRKTHHASFACLLLAIRNCCSSRFGLVPVVLDWDMAAVRLCY